MDRVRLPLSSAAAGLIGLLCTAADWGIGLAVLIPALAFIQTKRQHGALVAAMYYGTASRLVISAAKAFFGPSVTPIEVLCLWAVAVGLLTAPYAILWTSTASATAWRLPAAILASVPPPLGIIGWASPLTAAGILFPGAGWPGVLITLFAGVAVCLRPYLATAVLVLSMIISHALCAGPPAAPESWEGIYTRVGGVGLDRSSAVAEFAAVRNLQARIRSASGSVILLPETVVPVWTVATEYLWAPITRTFAEQGKTIIVGTRFLGSDGRRENGLVIRGATSGTFQQRIPVPVGMWRPGDTTSASIAPFGPSTIQVGSENVAPIICYEQFLTWPALTAAAHHATVIIAPANAYWARGTLVLARQRSLMAAWSRLFGVPIVSAVNE